MHDIKQPKIIIVGAGLIGTSTALCLANQSFDIEILESNLTAAIKRAKEDTRPISLSYGSHLMLKALGIWGHICDAACPIKIVHVSEKGRFGMTRITTKEQNVPALGYVVPFGKLQSTIYEKVATLPNVTMTPIEKIHRIENSESQTRLSIDNALEKSADLLIAADGTNSTCRQLLNIATSFENHDDSAFIFDLSLSDSHHFAAYERFTDHGVLAILPLHDSNKARLVWSMTASIKKMIAHWDEQKTLSFLQSVFVGRIAIETATKTATFPLQTVLADTQITSGAVLMGNAAHTIYPVAAQGFNLGLADITALQDTLREAIANNEPIGCKNILKRYIEKASPHQEAIIKLTNELTPLFELKLPFAGCVRGLGLLGLDLIDPLKNKLAQRAMGIIK